MVQAQEGNVLMSWKITVAQALLCFCKARVMLLACATAIVRLPDNSNSWHFIHTTQLVIC